MGTATRAGPHTLDRQHDAARHWRDEIAHESSDIVQVQVVVLLPLSMSPIRTAGRRRSHGA